MTPADSKAIPTRYKDILFRSKLEADWAITFDTLGVEWLYEKEGRYFGELFYYPDFYLPQSAQYFEVKGVLQRDDVKKWLAVDKHGDPLPHGDDSPDGWWLPDIKIAIGWPHGVFDVPYIMHDNQLGLCQCRKCKGWWFLDMMCSYRCRCCGEHDGDHHLLCHVTSPIQPFPLFNFNPHSW